MRVAMLGLGEAGSRFAADLAVLGADVSGWDPAPVSLPPGVHRSESDLDAVREADLVLSANSSSVALEAALEVSGSLRQGAVYADLNTASPALKARLAELFADGRVLFVDVALMAPVPRAGIRTPCLVSGSGAAAYRDLVAPFGAPVTVVSDRAGEASARKLLRSIFTKGMGTAAIEAMEAARALGCEEWLHRELAAELEAVDAAHLDRMLEGNRQHARRRIDEMRAAAELVRELDQEPLLSEAAARLLEKLLPEATGEHTREGGAG